MDAHSTLKPSSPGPDGKDVLVESKLERGMKSQRASASHGNLGRKMEPGHEGSESPAYTVQGRLCQTPGVGRRWEASQALRIEVGP